MNDLARQAILSYDDPLKVFLEMMLNNVEYFDKFPKIVKNEWIFTMKQRTYERGKCICRKGESAKEMFVIQSGEVEILTKMTNGRDFCCEKLYRGSILNADSFLMNDGIDTDAYCTKPVTVYVITIS